MCFFYSLNYPKEYFKNAHSYIQQHDGNFWNELNWFEIIIRVLQQYASLSNEEIAWRYRDLQKIKRMRLHCAYVKGEEFFHQWLAQLCNDFDNFGGLYRAHDTGQWPYYTLCGRGYFWGIAAVGELADISLFCEDF